MYNTYLNGIDFNVGIYIRLSQEDKDKKYESDSESVINQKELLRGYDKMIILLWEEKKNVRSNKQNINNIY